MILRTVSLWLAFGLFVHVGLSQPSVVLAEPEKAESGNSDERRPQGQPEASGGQASGPATEDRAPVLTKIAPLQLPEGLPLEGASVLLELLVNAEGTVVDARVLQGAGEPFDSLALAGIKEFAFEPAQVGGQPSAAKLQYQYVFPKQQAPKTSILKGQLLEAMGRKPLSGAAVRLDTGAEQHTDEAGNFGFLDVPPGTHTLMLSGPGFTTVQTSETLEAGKTLEVRYEVSQVAQNSGIDNPTDIDDLELVVIAPKLVTEIAASRVSASSARRLAGAQGDALKVVENMPGVARASAGSGDLVVWGAAPLDTRVYIDTVRVPALYHFGGFRSVIHSDLVSSVELTPGGYGAAYGRGLGGLVTVETADPPSNALKGSAQVDLLDAAVALQGPLSEKTSFSLGLRRSHIKEILERQLDARSREVFPLPRYYDGAARVRYQLDESAWLELGGLLSGDSMTRVAAGADPLSRREETKELAFQRVYLNYNATRPGGVRIRVSPWFGRDYQSTRGRFESIPVEQGVSSLVGGFRAEWSGPILPQTTGTVGLDFEGASAKVMRQGSISAPAREGDARVFGQTPADQVNVDTWHTKTASAAPYVAATLALFENALQLTPGLRFEPMFTSVDRRRPREGASPDVGAQATEFSLQPRFAGQLTLAKRLKFKTAVGIYRQAPLAEDLSPVFGNPLLGNSKAFHAILGVNWSVSDTFSLDLTLFHSDSESLAVRNSVASPRVAEALVNAGRGRANGLQVLIKKDLSDHWQGWIAYTLLKSQRQDRSDTSYRPFDYDQTHVLTAVASYEFPLGIEAGLRGRAATGYPRTPVIGAYYDARRDAYEPVLGEVNTTRIPTFLQLDVRVSKRFALSNTELEAYVDVQNVTNRKNPEEIVYNADYSSQQFLRGFPLLPVLGLRWSF